MLARPILIVWAFFAAPAAAGPAASFEQRVVAIMNAGGTTDAMVSRLNSVAADPSVSVDQSIAVDALKLLVRSRSKQGGLSVAEAEQFASRNPTSAASAILVAEAALANDEPQRSADTLIDAAPRAGSLIQLVSPTAVSKLTDQLDAFADRKRTAGLAKALIYARWARGSASLRSYLALAAIRDELAAGRIERARAILTLIKSPATLHEILIDGRLSALRGDVERIGGPRLETAWRDYLVSARDEWLNRGDALSAVSYVEALKQANDYDALASAFLMRFMKGYNCPSDLVARSIGSDLADSLARTGRWTRAEDVMRRSGGISPPIYAAMLLERGDFAQAETLLGRSLKAASVPKTKSDEKALAWLQGADACAAFRGKRGTVSARLDPGLLEVSARMFVLLCLNRMNEARDALIAALANEDERADALRWVQPFKDPASPSKFREEMNEKVRALQHEQVVIDTVARYGTILDWPLTSAVPEELAVGTPANSWQCGQQSDWQMAMPKVESVHLPDTTQ
jgi:hypothetical protein